MKKFISIILMLVLMASCVTMVACGGGDDDGDLPGFPTADSSPDARPSPADTAGTSGDFTWDDIPVYPGADREEEFSMSMGGGGEYGDFERIEYRYYSTGDDPDEVGDFYKDKMPDKGWTEVMIMDMGEVSFGYWEKDGGDTGAYIGAAEDDGDTMLWMWRGTGIDGGDTPDWETPPTPPTMSTPPTLPTVSTPPTIGDIPAPGEVDPLHFNDLIPFLPDVPSGWEADEPYGMTMSGMEGYSYTIALREYNNASGEYVDVTIYDSAYYQGFIWFQLYDEDLFFDYETSDGYAKTTTVKGYPTWEVYSKPDTYNRVILVAERFVVMINVETKSSLDQFTNAVDFSGLAGVS